MSPISNIARFAAHGDATLSTVQSTSIDERSTDLPSTSTPLRIDTAAAPETASSSESNHGMPLGTKLGLGLLPLIVVLCALWIFFLFWLRTRKAKNVAQRTSAPPVPEKDPASLIPSLDISRRGSKVFNMAAFSTPIYDGQDREAQISGQGHGTKQTQTVNQREKDEIRTTTMSMAASETRRSDLDSPIDSTSPFRLKRGDTIRRSLGSEISTLWPSPPPTAWVKRPSITERVHSPTIARQYSFSTSQHLCDIR